NSLMDTTGELEEEHAKLVQNLQDLLNTVNMLKRNIEHHENTSCKKSIRLREADLFAGIDYPAMIEAMKPLQDDDDLSEIGTAPSPAPSPAPNVVVKTAPISACQPLEIP